MGCKTSDVTNFLRYIIDTTLTNTVDADGYVVKVDSGDPVLVKDNTGKRALILYQEQIKDTSALIVNPLAAGLGDNPATNWFYQRLQASFNSRVIGLIDFLLTVAVEDKKKKDAKAKKKDGEDKHLPMELIRVISPIIDDVDDTTINEFHSLVADADSAVEFINIHYQPRQMRCTIRSGLFEDGYTAGHPKVRKKTWTVLTKLMRGIFNLKDDEDTHKFATKRTDVSCTKLASFLHTMFNAFSEMNGLLDIQDKELSIDLTKWKTHLDNIEDYANNAKFMVQPTMEAAVQAPTAATSVPTLQGTAQQQQAQPGTVLIPVLGAPGGGTGSVAIPDTSTTGGTGSIPLLTPTSGGLPAMQGMGGMNMGMGMGMPMNPLSAPPMSVLTQPPAMGGMGMGMPMGTPGMGGMNMGMGMPVQPPNMWPAQAPVGNVMFPGMRPLS